MRLLPREVLGRRDSTELVEVRRRGTRSPKPVTLPVPVLGLSAVSEVERPTATAARFLSKLRNQLGLEKRRATRQTA